MVDVERCPECGIPKQVSDTHEWLNNGVIVLKGSPGIRLAYIDCEPLDPLFNGIGQLIGTTVEPIVVHAVRRGTREYIGPTITPEIREQVRTDKDLLLTIVNALILTTRINGGGCMELKEMRYEYEVWDFITHRYLDPHSVPVAMGEIAGSCEAVTGNEFSDCSYTRIAPGTYEMTARATRVPFEPEGRQQPPQYHWKKGDAEFERCATCGAPREFRNYKWDIDLGTIRSTQTVRRITIIGPAVYEHVFKEMWKKLGAILPVVVIETQRRFTRSGFYNIEEITDGERWRNQLILRGMGNLKEYEISPKGLRFRLDNACMHLLVLGMVQGLYERAFEKESSVQWELSEEGVLQAEISPLFSKFLI